MKKKKDNTLTGIKKRFDLSGIALISIYLISIAVATMEYTNALPDIALSRGLLAVGLQLILIYAYICLYPSRLVSGKTQTVSIFYIICVLLFSNFLLSLTRLSFIFELIIIITLMILSISKHIKIYKWLNLLNLSEYSLLEFKSYKIFEQNILNLILNLAMLIALKIVGYSIVSFVYSIAVFILLAFTNYDRMFTIHLDCVNMAKYFIETSLVGLAYFLINLFANLEVAIGYYLIIVICIVPNIYFTYKIGKELHKFMFRRR